MKFVITMKNPDSVDDSIRRAIDDEVTRRIENQTPDEVEEMRERIDIEVREACQKFIRWNEYIDIEIDTENKSAMVMEVD